MLYDCGDPQAPAAHPHVLADDLSGPSTFFRDGHALLERSSDRGPIVDLVKLVPRLRITREFSVDSQQIVDYDGRSAPSAFGLYGSRLTGRPERFVRTRDGATISVPYQCRLVAASKTDVISRCAWMSGRLSYQDIEDFKFPMP